MLFDAFAYVVALGATVVMGLVAAIHYGLFALASEQSGRGRCERCPTSV